jgi:hypothetical protein
MEQKKIGVCPLALTAEKDYIADITRAVPLVRKVNAHQGRVFYFHKFAAAGRAV